MQQRHLDRRLYFEELAETSQRYFIPFLEEYYGDIDNIRVLEIGCGDGGNLLPFLKRGCEVVGVDISEARVRQAQEFFSELGYTPDLIGSDIFKLDDLGTFDIVIVHDVIEHIGAKKEFLEHIKPFLTPGGVFFIAFPAWQMPFGGHQQICKSPFLSHFPYMHLFPRLIYRQLLKWGKEKPGTIDELLDIKRCGLSIEHFRELVNQTGLKILKQQLYFINPHYETKFGLRPVKLSSFFRRLPYLRNFYTTSCFYLLERSNSN